MRMGADPTLARLFNFAQTGLEDKELKKLGLLLLFNESRLNQCLFIESAEEYIILINFVRNILIFRHNVSEDSSK